MSLRKIATLLVQHSIRMLLFLFQKAGFLFLIFEFVYTKCYKSPLLLYNFQIHIRHMKRIAHIKITRVLFIHVLTKGWDENWHTKNLYYGMMQLLIQRNIART